MILVESYGIGIGKSHLVTALAEMMKSRAYHEKVDVELLAEFYKDVENNVKPSHHAFTFQFEMMANRYWSHIQAQQYEWTTFKQTVHDRSIIGDHAFAHKLMLDGFLSENDYRVYVQHRKLMEGQLLTPQVVIRLEASPEKCIERIKERMSKDRGRESECTVSVEYLSALRESYEKVVWPWFEKRGTSIVTYDYEEFIDSRRILADVSKYLPVQRLG